MIQAAETNNALQNKNGTILSYIRLRNSKGMCSRTRMRISCGAKRQELKTIFFPKIGTAGYLKHAPKRISSALGLWPFHIGEGLIQGAHAEQTVHGLRAQWELITFGFDKRFVWFATETLKQLMDLIFTKKTKCARL